VGVRLRYGNAELVSEFRNKAGVTNFIWEFWIRCTVRYSAEFVIGRVYCNNNNKAEGGSDTY
jgi:hypothetical protein